MPQAELRDLLEAGVHFGHQTRRWNPNMRRFIFGEMDGIHIIDLLQTEALLENARKFAGELATGGGTVLFVGTKKQAADTVQEWADRCKMPYVNKRWLGGLLTNFNTMSGRIARLHQLNGWKEEGKLDLLPTKERMGMEAELAKLEFNDDAIRSCELVIGTIGGAIEEGSSAWRVQEEKRIAVEMERRKREEEERKKREEEEKVRVEALEAKKAAEEAEKAAQATAQAQQKAQQAQRKAPQGQGAGAAGPAAAGDPPSPAQQETVPPTASPAAEAPKESGQASGAQVQATPAGAAVEAQAAPPEASVAEVKEEGSEEQPPAPPEESAKAADTEEKAGSEGEAK
jgi:small subunit ribosomal protein S2